MPKLVVGVSPSSWVPPYRKPQLLLTEISVDLEDALQTKQAFLVASAGDLFLKQASIAYSLTQERLDLLAAAGGADLIARLQALVPTMWSDAASLDLALKNVLTPEQYDAELITGAIRNGTGDFSLFVAGWEFDLSPWRWIDHQSILIFKFCAGSLVELVGEQQRWAGPESFNAASIATQQKIQASLSYAQEKYAAGDIDWKYFVETVISCPDWEGVLVFNAALPFSGLPQEMKHIAASIDPSQFLAHHIGINTATIKSSDAADPTPSSVFALIDYACPTILSGSDASPFKVSALKVFFLNSEVVSFHLSPPSILDNA